MIKVDRGTEKELYVLTSPNCHFCKMLHESGKGQDFPITKYFVLAEYMPSDKLVNRVIFKAVDPLASFHNLLVDGSIEDHEIDWDKDVDDQCKANTDMFLELTSKFGLNGTPAFILKDGDNMKVIEPPHVDPIQQWIDSVGEAIK